LAKENKLYIFVDLKKNQEVQYFLLSKLSGYRVALSGKLCNLGKLEPCDSNLIKIRNQIKPINLINNVL